MKEIFSVLLPVFLIWIPLSQAQQNTNISEFPTINDDNSLQIYLLSGAFPYNTPQNIKEAAGLTWEKYSINHQAVGIWDTTSGAKFSLEFSCANFTGQLFPLLGDESDDYSITWINNGVITYTNPVSSDEWISSSLVTTTNGAAWNQLLNYIQDNQELYYYYQPVTVGLVNTSKSSSDSLDYPDLLGSRVDSQIIAVDSVYFVNNIFDQLSSYGCDLEGYLPISHDVYVYAQRYGTAASQPVDYTSNPNQQRDVNLWYQNLQQCYKDAYNSITSVDDGAKEFLENVTCCYSSYAYIFDTTTSVTNITLANQSVANSSDRCGITPLFTQQYYYLPPADYGNNSRLSPLDWILVIGFLLGSFTGLIYLVYICRYKKKERTRLSFQGEELAKRTVENMEDEDRDYMHRIDSTVSGVFKRFWKRHVANTDNMNKAILDDKSQEKASVVTDKSKNELL